MTSDDEQPTAPVVCTACGTTNRVPLSEVAETVERHNERVHDGAAKAEVDPDVADQLADLVARDLGFLDE
ncbi:hypothetical protein [Halarchaeum nitratireducens]|uniref:DUF8149 domain-containing protein n=1 Tax=Halarchaeum nitratireducens TaxID=489913 RepID=A0A830G8F6_9EURY|nr:MULTISPECIES: hypothetical protein [Halarchaeum]MBP2249877.1 hypothetical protein [Halarchaeum solikamskense]GGN10029.1 hypothetical protein GCM10009021_07170 [Halarchaeum nitratireducens]